MDVSESDKKLWELIRERGFEAGRAEWEQWRRDVLEAEERRLMRGRDGPMRMMR